MKRSTMVFLVFMSFMMWNCKKEKSSEKAAVVETPMLEKKDTVMVEEHPELYGIYSGDFEVDYSEGSDDYEAVDHRLAYKKISIKINRIAHDSVYGHSIVTGNQRPFVGVFNSEAKSFTLNEPGDDKTDGKFELQLRGDSLVGKWMVYDTSAVKIPKKIVRLVKRNFEYNPNLMLDKDSELIDWDNPKEFISKYIDPDTGMEEQFTDLQQRIASDAVFKINASTQKLTEKDLKNLRKLDMQIIKNMIFARHGYSFKKYTYRQFFEHTDWYIPMYNNVDDRLSQLEKDNVILLNRMIKYAEDHYDSFGR